MKENDETVKERGDEAFRYFGMVAVVKVTGIKTSCMGKLPVIQKMAKLL